MKPYSWESLMRPFISRLFFFILILASVIESPGLIKRCALDQIDSKWTYLGHDAILYLNESLQSFCFVNASKVQDENFSLENLKFSNEGEFMTDTRNACRLNETLICAHTGNSAEELEYLYSCHKNTNETNELYFESTNTNSLMDTSKSRIMPKNVVCINAVTGGDLHPKKVENFSCIIDNFEALKCTWDVGKNFFKTNYTIRYKPRHRGGREASQCPNDDDIKYNSCTWTLTTRPPYRKNFRELKIFITGKNKFNVTEEGFNLNQSERIVPQGPNNLQMLNRTATSVLLQWSINDLHLFYGNWSYKIVYRTNYTDLVTLLCQPKNVTRNESLASYNVTNLIPNLTYYFQVYMKSSNAPPINFWSVNAATNEFQTASSKPVRSPDTDIGSFHLEQGPSESTRWVYLYWKALPITEYRGDKFQYQLRAYEVDENGAESSAPAPHAKCLNVTLSFAQYEIGLSAYKFYIRSSNALGDAPTATSIRVPSARDAPKFCARVSKIEIGDGAYTVAWQPPTTTFGNPVTNYTIFWCRSEKEGPHRCDDAFNWTRVPPDTYRKSFFFNSSGRYRFAISAITAQSGDLSSDGGRSSGMLWVTCSMRQGYLPTIDNLYAAQVGAAYIQLKWMWPLCWDLTANISGVRVDYCRLAASQTDDVKCVGPEQLVLWKGDDGSLSSGNVSGLRPYTRYRVTARVYSTQLVGEPGVPVVLRTSEGSPPVEGLRTWIVARTNTSAIVRWDMPEATYGALSHFNVRWRRRIADSVDEAETVGVVVVKSTEATISNLIPSVRYDVTVQACTSVDCALMPFVSFRTRAGVPEAPVVVETSSEDLNGPEGGEVVWNPAAWFTGPHSYYELQVVLERNESQQLQKWVTNRTRFLVKVPECSGAHKAAADVYLLRLRAVIVDGDDGNGTGLNDDAPSLSTPLPSPTVAPVEYVGPWSLVYRQYCITERTSLMWTIVAYASIPLLLFCILIFLFVSRKIFLKCKRMKSVKVVVPMQFSAPASTEKVSRVHDRLKTYSWMPLSRVNDSRKPANRSARSQ